MPKKFQEYLFKKAENTRSMTWAVFILSMFESIFLFIPTEVFMTPPIVAKKKNAVPVVIAAAIGSLIGGAIAYAIGFYLYSSVGSWLINTFASEQSFEIAKQMFHDKGMLIILMAAFTPVPYKVLSIVAGFVSFNPFIYLGLTAVFRTLRFIIAGFLLWRFQEYANRIAKKYFIPITLAAILLAGLGLFLL